MYDYLLTENYHQARNHRYDLRLIARMLRHEGLSVAILDVYGDDDLPVDADIPVLRLPDGFGPVPDDRWQAAPRHKLHSLACKLRFLWQNHRFWRRVVQYVTPLAGAFYFGSYHLLMPCALLNVSKPSYFWGLRSGRMVFSWGELCRRPIESVQLLRLRHRFLHRPACRLLVSNTLIRDEFLALGLPAWRLALREERCIDSAHIGEARLDQLNALPTLLVIGQLRREKHVPLTLEAFRQAGLAQARLVVAGRSLGHYEDILRVALCPADPRIERRNEYLDDAAYEACLTAAHFVVFADEQGPSGITNGTMMEALICHRPIICPDFDPFRHYVTRYGIGLLYRPGDAASYAGAMREAVRLGVRHFQPAIEAFLHTVTFDIASRRLVRDLQQQP